MKKLSDMKPQTTSYKETGEVYDELPHQVHMRYIKHHLRERNMSWSQFGAYINHPEYPLSGTRKERLEKTALALDKNPGYLDGIIRHMEGK